jgi:hypothetical protein
MYSVCPAFTCVYVKFLTLISLSFVILLLTLPYENIFHLRPKMASEFITDQNGIAFVINCIRI